MIDFKPLPKSKIGELAARFEIVLGRTPDELSLQRGRDTGPLMDLRKFNTTLSIPSRSAMRKVDCLCYWQAVA